MTKLGDQLRRVLATRRARCALAAVAALAALALPGVALAYGGSVTISGTTLVYQAPGQFANQVRITESESTLWVSETGITAVAPCVQGGPDQASCPKPGVTGILVDAGALDDYVITVGNLPATVNAGPGNDVVETGSGPDTVNGGTGDDVLLAGACNATAPCAPTAESDTYHGGDGVDVVTYSSRPLGVNVTLDDVANDGRGDENDNVLSIENVTGTDGDDILTGNHGPNSLDGGPGNDTLNGLAGSDRLDGGNGGGDWLDGGGGNDDLFGGFGGLSDTLIGGGGDDILRRAAQSTLYPAVLQGGSGTDTASYAQSGASVLVSLDGVANDGVAGVNDNVGADIENVLGSRYNDTIRGSSAANVLDGGEGPDDLDGLSGNDTLNGGADFDTLTAGGGADQLDGQDGPDRLRVLFGGLAATITVVDTGATGTDVLSVDAGGADDVIQITASSVSATGKAVDYSAGVERVEVNGQGGNDSLRVSGTGAEVALFGGAGDDDLVVAGSISPNGVTADGQSGSDDFSLSSWEGLAGRFFVADSGGTGVDSLLFPCLASLTFEANRVSNGSQRIVFGGIESRTHCDADLSVTAVASSPSVLGNGVFTFRIANATPGADQAIDVTATFSPLAPGGSTVVSARADQGTCSGATCTLGTIPAGGALQVAVVLHPGGAGELSLSGAVSSANDPLSGNDSASASLGAIPATPLRGDLVFNSDRDANRELYLMNATGAGQRNLTADPHGDGLAAFSPDAETVVFDREVDGNVDIYSMRIDGTGLTRLTSDPGVDASASFSPDGTKIAFASDRIGDQFEVFVMDANGSNIRRLTSKVGDDDVPSFSPDGTKIAFNGTRDGNSEIYVMTADGKQETNLTKNPGEDADRPTWSPDGTRIAFTSTRDGDSEIFVMNADGSAQQNLTNNTVGDGNPSWSPNGLKIAFASTRDAAEPEIYTMTPAGTGVTRLTTNPASDALPAWVPARRVAFTGFAPSSGHVGSTVTLTGTNLDLVTGVTLYGINALSWSLVSPTEIQATVPSIAVPQARWRLISVAGVVLHSSPFTVTSSPMPSISSVSPLSGLVGSEVTILGSNFTAASVVTLYGINATFTLLSPTEIRATVPAIGGVPQARWRVVTPGGTATYDPLFTVLAPVVSSVSPMSGVVGSAVTITGSNFSGVTAVTLYGIASPSFTVVSPSEIRATVPAIGVPQARWRVVSPGGTVTYEPLFTATLPPPPAISSVSSSSGVVGSEVTITGSNFNGVTAVSLYGIASPSVTVVSPNEIRAIVPAIGVPQARWRVVGPGGTAVHEPSFTALVPTISSVTPMSGPVGSEVTIRGSNFSTVSGVTLYGIDATSFTVGSQTEIRATVPAIAVPQARWRIVTPGGTFAYEPLFTVTS